MPEGIEGRVAHKGSVAAMIHQLVGRPARRHGLLRLRRHPDAAARREADSHHAAGLRESHVHDVVITKEAPNYRIGIGFRVVAGSGGSGLSSTLLPS